jgi:hypothetical protein
MQWAKIAILWLFSRQIRPKDAKYLKKTSFQDKKAHPKFR